MVPLSKGGSRGMCPFKLFISISEQPLLWGHAFRQLKVFLSAYLSNIITCLLSLILFPSIILTQTGCGGDGGLAQAEAAVVGGHVFVGDDAQAAVFELARGQVQKREVLEHAAGQGHGGDA